MSKKIKVILTLFFLVSFLVTSYLIGNTYALFETNLVSTYNIETGKWEITINETLIEPTTTSFVLDQVTILENSYVINQNKIAPGTEGYFDIEINPNDTDVSIQYEISFDFSKIPTGIQILGVTETNGDTLVETTENTFSNIITLNEIKEGKKNNIRVNIRWVNNEDNNDSDSALGTVYNNSLLIPVDIMITQYLGESIE